MLKTNRDKLPIVSVQGEVWHPRATLAGRMDTRGMANWLQGTGGITYNAKIGDVCTGWVADHLEPGVSTRNSDDSKNAAYVTLSCIGNEAVVKTGDAKGEKGVVTGKHGGCEHLMVYFPDSTLEKLSIEDKIGIRASGQGMALTDYPDIILRSMSPALLDKMNIKEKKGTLEVGVAKIIPACIMGSGLGAGSSASGDYDITLFDEVMTKQHGLDDLRFGDIVAITDADTRYGRTFRTGAITIGVVIHGDCILAGHGPGVTTLMSSKTALIKPIVDAKANLATYFAKPPAKATGKAKK